MAKLKPIDEISRDFVGVIRAEWNRDLAFTPRVLEIVRVSEWDQIDILEVVEDGAVVEVKKDEPHETFIELSHTTASGYSLSVTVAYDPHRPGFCVVEVSLI